MFKNKGKAKENIRVFLKTVALTVIVIILLVIGFISAKYFFANL